MLDAPSDEKIEIYIYASQSPRCYGGISCYDALRRMVRTRWGSLEHEVVHAVVDRFAQPTVFWSDGRIRDRATRHVPRRPPQPGRVVADLHEFELVEGGLFKVVVMAREQLESATVTLRRTPPG